LHRGCFFLSFKRANSSYWKMGIIK
jgi:hypothetical protein